MDMLESKWDTASVKSFLGHYMEAMNKESFSNEIWKPSFDKHIEANIL